MENQENTEVQETMDDTASKAFDEIMSREVTNEQENVVETPEEKAQRERDEQGRFAKEQPSEEVKTEPVLEDRPPSSWKPHLKEKWSTLEPEVRAEILRRESDSFKGYEQIRPDAEYGKAFRSFIEPYQPLLSQLGGETKAIGDLFYTANLFHNGTDQEKVNAVHELINRFKIPFNLNGAEPIPLNNDLLRLNEEVNSLKNRLEQEKLHKQNEELSKYTKAAEKWMSEKDKEGKPLRPYLDSVLEDVQFMVPQIRKLSPDLPAEQVYQQAYEKAVWANPETRARLQEEEQAKAKSQEENLRRTNEAKRAASNNVVRKGVFQTSTKKGSMEATANEYLDSINYGG